MKLNITLDLSHAANALKCQVTHVSRLANGKLKCSIKLEKYLPKTLADQLNKYLMRYANVTPEQIRNAGLKVQSIKEFINYRYAETQADYEAILRTRRFTYSGVDKIDSKADLEKVSYFFDDYSQILMVMHNEEIIGSATIILGDGKEKPFEIQTFFDEKEIELPPSDKTLEVAALCLHPDYRDTDILHGVFEQIDMLTLMLNKDYIIASSDKHLIKLYKSIGFQKTPYRFVQPKYNQLTMEVLVIHRDAAIMAKGVKKLIWWPLWGTVNHYLQNRRVLSYSPYQKIKAGILKRIFRLFFRLKYRRPWMD